MSLESVLNEIHEETEAHVDAIEEAADLAAAQAEELRYGQAIMGFNDTLGEELETLDGMAAQYWCVGSAAAPGEGGGREEEEPPGGGH